MSQFDATDSAEISRKIAEHIKRPSAGRVVEVFERATEGSNSNFEVDVEIISSLDKQHRAIPWQNPQNGEIKVPKVGDKVIVEYRGSSDKSAIARSCVYTNLDRPPVGRAGMWRKRVTSDTSPAGDGDLYVESYTSYDVDPASPEFDEDEANPQDAYIRVSKKVDDVDSSFNSDLPVMFELFDNPADDEAYISLELNKRDGSDTSNTWGVKFDVKTGEMKILDASGYGIESDGDGNFTWHYETIDHSKGTKTSL